jgi:chromosome segregation ATPase
MARDDRHWQKIEAHLKKWVAELDRARAGAETEVAKIQTQYYQRLAELRTEIEHSLKRWDAEVKALKQRAGTTESEVARGLEEFRARLKAELTAWQPELEQLKGRAARAKADAKRLADELRTQSKLATKRMAVLRRTAGESWDEIRPAIERAWGELRPALRSAAAKFREPRPQGPGAISRGSTHEPGQEPTGKP